MHLNWIFFWKVDFLILLKPVIIRTWYVKTNETIIMAMNKFQRSRLTFNFSAKIAHIGSPINTLKHSLLRNH